MFLKTQKMFLKKRKKKKTKTKKNENVCREQKFKRSKLIPA